MRTTLDIEDDILLATKELARQKNLSAGKVISQLLRVALSQSTEINREIKTNKTNIGFVPFPASGILITNEKIDTLRDLEGV